MRKQKDPLEEARQRIKERGLLLFDNITRAPIYEKQYASPFLVICLHQEGWLKALYDNHQIVFQRHDLVIIPPGHVLQAQEASDDYLVSLLVVSPEYSQKVYLRNPFYIEMERYLYHSAFPLNEKQFKGTLGYFRMLDAISQLEHSDRDNLLASLMKTGTQLIDLYLLENGELPKPSPSQQLLQRFQNAVINHFRESREVQYYANLLCLSPKYFGNIIKKETGVSASEWISSYVIIQAKSLLRHSRSLNIQQISNQLGFPDPAAFTRYFKANAGMTPKEYRAQQ